MVTPQGQGVIGIAHKVNPILCVVEIVLNTLKMYSNMFILQVRGFRVTDLIV